MKREGLFQYITQEYDIQPDYPWNDENAVLRHRDNRKWFAVVLKVSKEKLGMSGDEVVDVLNVKSDPELIGTLRMKDGFHPAYHMNKEKWISVRLDGSVSFEEIKSLIELSYDLTKSKKKQPQKREKRL
jgi:predicted DNA-binding protein (MmcQ/YjbR family)